MPKAVGIDLGTTNSVVSVLEGGEPVVIPNSEGGRTTPSVVAFSKTGEVLVGEVAKRQAITNPDRTFRSVKRHMGEAWKSEDIDGKQYTAQEISARTLMKLKRDAESYLGDTVTQAVITVPAYFDDAQRTATKEAGTIAGLEVLRIINEPTAAALAYGLDKGDEDETILVFDLGGGTFDVSVLEIGDGVFEVKSTHGDTVLGGDDWDQRIIDWLVQQFKAAQGVDLSADRMAAQRLQEAAEKAKIELSQTQSTQINLPFITATADGPLHLDETLSRSKFQELTADLIERCRVPFEQALKDAGVAKGELNHVILVGLPPAMQGVPQIEVTFDIDANGIVHVSAKDRATDKTQSMTITGQSTLDKDVIDQMVKDAEAHAEEDKQRLAEAEARNNADSLVYQTEKVLRDQGDTVPAEEKDAVEAPLADLKKALEGNDHDAIRTATEALMAASQAFSQKLYEAAAKDGGAEGSSASGQGDGAVSDDDIVDAEIVDDPADGDAEAGA